MTVPPMTGEREATKPYKIDPQGDMLCVIGPTLHCMGPWANTPSGHAQASCFRDELNAAHSAGWIAALAAVGKQGKEAKENG